MSINRAFYAAAEVKSSPIAAAAFERNRAARAALEAKTPNVLEPKPKPVRKTTAPPTRAQAVCLALIAVREEFGPEKFTPAEIVPLQSKGLEVASHLTRCRVWRSTAESNIDRALRVL